MSIIMRYAETDVLNGANSNFIFIQLECLPCPVTGCVTCVHT